MINCQGCGILTYRANAKINLLLDVTGRMPNGYHSVVMIMHSVTLCDLVTVERAQEGIEIICSEPGIPTDERNIVWKAVRAFEQALGIHTGGLRITIEKHIPSQAGLGGGSADAAAVLTALRDLFLPALPDENLRGIGAKVGADVPFCLLGGCCLAEGIGEVLTPLPRLPEGTQIEICKPAAGVSTAGAYAALDSAGIVHPKTQQAIVCAQHGDWHGMFPLCANVFEQVISLPGLAEYKQGCMQHGAMTAQMTGSGSAVFSVWEPGKAIPLPDIAYTQRSICAPAQQGVEQV